MALYLNGKKLSGEPHNYSTDEQVVGTWIDGSTLYEKTVDLSSSAVKDTSWHNVAHNISNIDKVVSVEGIVINNLNEYYPIPIIRPALLDPANVPMGIAINVDNTNIRFMNNWLEIITYFYATIRYTK